MYCRLPGSSVHRIFQAGILQSLAISSSRDLSHLGIDPAFLVSPELVSLPLHYLGSLNIGIDRDRCKDR